MNEELYGLLGLDPEKIRQQQMTQGLLGAGLQALAASGPSRMPTSLGQIVGQAGMAGLQGYQQAEQNAISRALQGLQVSEFARRQKQEQSGRQALQGLYERMSGTTPQGALAAPGGQVGPTAERAATIGQRQPMTAQELLAIATNPDISEATRKNLIDAAQLLTPKPQETPASYREYLLAKQDPVSPYQGSYAQYQLDMRRAGGTNVSVSTEKSYGGALAGEVAKSDAAKFEAANSAPNVIQTIQSTRNLLDTGNVITGIGAQQRLDLARFGQLLGVGGTNSNERVANTQQLFANRAQATLDSIRSSGLGAGQGFSNKDREFLENARLGNITYDATSLRRQLDIEEKVARATVSSWNNRIENIPREARQSLGLSKVELAPPTTTAPAPNKAPPGVRQELWDMMTPEQKKLW